MCKYKKNKKHNYFLHIVFLNVKPFKKIQNRQYESLCFHNISITYYFYHIVLFIFFILNSLKIIIYIVCNEHLD